MRAHAARVQRQDLVLEVTQPRLPLRHWHRLERAPRSRGVLTSISQKMPFRRSFVAPLRVLPRALSATFACRP